jgi:hypothetical protein
MSGSKFSRSFQQSFDIHRAIDRLSRNSSEPVDLSQVVASIRREGLALSLSDKELAEVVVRAARDAGVPLWPADEPRVHPSLDESPELISNAGSARRRLRAISGR